MDMNNEKNNKDDGILHSQPVEQALLAAMLVEPSVIDQLGDKFSAKIFHHPTHQTIAQSIIRQYDASGYVDFSLVTADSSVTFPTEIDKNDYLAELAESCITTTGCAQYVDQLYRMFLRRRFISIMDDFANRAREEDDLDQVVDKLEQDVLNLRFSKNQEQAVDLGIAQAEALQWVEGLRNGTISPQTTGFDKLDKLISGFLPEKLYIVAARPGMGKTALALNMAEATAKQGATLFFSMEMGKAELAMRIMARATGISLVRQTDSKNLTDQEFHQLCATRSALANSLLIDDRSGLTISNIAASARRVAKQRGGLRAIFIDYLGLIQGDNRLQRVHQIEEITKACKQLSKELKTPVILLSQLNRSLEQRENKRPMLADLRDSGSIEQDADVVMFIYREEYYLERSEPKLGGGSKAAEAYTAWQEQLDASRGQAEIIIAKNRQGGLGTARLIFAGVRQEFSD